MAKNKSKRCKRGRTCKEVGIDKMQREKKRTWSEGMEFMVFMFKLSKNKYNEQTHI